MFAVQKQAADTECGVMSTAIGMLFKDYKKQTSCQHNSIAYLKFNFKINYFNILPLVLRPFLSTVDLMIPMGEVYNHHITFIMYSSFLG